MAELLANNPQGSATASAPELVDQTPADETVIQTEGEEPTPQDETEEVEHEGQKYKLPKALKGALLMQQDYTRKTQEVSEQRKTLETRQAEFTQQTQAHQELIKDVANLQTLTSLVELYEKTDWQALRGQDANAAQDRWFEYQQIMAAKNKAADELRGKMEKRNLDAQQATAKREEETKAILSREISWTPELHGKMTDFATREFGFTPTELKTTATDPRVSKLLHRAYLGDQALKREAAAKKLANQDGLKPAPQVGSSASPNTRRTTNASGDKMPIEQWMKQEAERTKKAARG